jgi:Mn2+/Fe2+ NRAMP family transporter
VTNQEWEATYKLGFRNGLEVARRTQDDMRWWLAWTLLVLTLAVIMMGVLADPAGATPVGCMRWWQGHWVCR